MTKNFVKSRAYAYCLLLSQICIVAFDQHIQREFKSQLSKALSETVESGEFIA